MEDSQNNTNKKEFPYDFEVRRKLIFYPARPTHFYGDILEIGPGRGDWLLAQAKKETDKKFMAIEIGKKRYFRLIPRIQKRGLANILLICGDARIVLPQYFTENTFKKIVVMFPDPWPKDRHAFRRLLTVEFLTLLVHLMKQQGLFLLATDVASYANWVKDNLKKVTSLSPLISPPSGDPPFWPTFFEQKWRAEGRKIYYLCYQKIG